MKKNLLTAGAMLLGLSSVFGQVQQIPKFSTEAEKAAWILQNSDDYQRMSGTELPSSNQTPDFKTQAEKDAWIQQSNLKQKALLTQEQKESSISTEVAKDAYLKKQANTVYISQEEFNALPEVKKASVLADKNYVIIK
jgi:hypothetical protein